MSLYRRWIILGVLGAAAAASQAAMPREYEVLRERSIFSRERPRRASTQPTTRSVSTSPAAAVLVGILQSDNEYQAVFEVPGGGRPSPRKVGESVPGSGGTITQITLDNVEYTPSPGGSPRNVVIGRSLDGSESVLGATSATQPASGDAPVEGEDLISRMKRRRLLEAGK